MNEAPAELPFPLQRDFFTQSAVYHHEQTDGPFSGRLEVTPSQHPWELHPVKISPCCNKFLCLLFC